MLLREKRGTETLEDFKERLNRQIGNNQITPEEAFESMEEATLRERY